MSRRVLLLTLVAIACNAAAFGQTCPSSVSWCSGTYSYDAMGNIRAIGADTYVYDTAGRLVSGTAGVQQTPTVVSRQDYSYDAFGNRTGASRIAGSVDCLGGCELSPAIDPSTNHIIGFGAQYDEAGNLKFIQGIHDATYTYDAAGSLVHAVAGTDDRQFLYTADDERIATANGANGATWTWTVRGLDGKVLREFTSLQAPGGLPTSNWQWTKDYVWRDGLLLASVTPKASGGTATQHFHLDHLGTPRLVTGDNGVQLSVHAYYPFGAELNLTPTEQLAELMKFTGHERDLLANDPHTLDYMHARYEMGAMGRFLSVDPVLDLKKAMRNPQSWNRYAYVRNNPLNSIDPDGKDDFSIGDDFTDPFGQTSARADVTPLLKSLLHVDDLREAFTGFSTAPNNEKAMAIAVGAIALLDIGSNFLAPEKTGVAGAEAIGLKSFGAFKRMFGAAGAGMEWHHIVEQTSGNAARFGGEALHNTVNLVRMDAATHAKLSAYYSSKQAFTGGVTVRQWLATKSFQEQYEFGQQVILRLLKAK